MSETPEQADADNEVGEILKANSPGREQIEIGMDVMSIDGERIGKVKEIRDADFLVDRPLAHDLWVPFSAVMGAGERGGSFRRGPTQPTELVLSISSSHVEAQGWKRA